MNTFAGQFVRGIYRMPEDNNELGLVFTAKEVAHAIPGFHESVLGYTGQVNAAPSVVISKLDEA
jgi:hypothetical protein